MHHLSSFSTIRAAHCTITDRSEFLRHLQAAGELHDVHIICFNADMIAGRAHALTALSFALRAFEKGTNISNTIEMESLLYAAGSRQCNTGASFGIHEGENRVWICCSSDRGEESWTALSPLFQYTREDWDLIDCKKAEQLMQNFSVSPEEIEAAGGPEHLPELVLERVALLQVLR